MIMHVLKHCNHEFDYMVGALIDGFETMVYFSDSSTVAIFEGDEYLSSPIDKRPKFHLYKPHIAVISGIAWDHINVFPTFDIYKEQFSTFIDLMEHNGALYYYGGDPELAGVVAQSRNNIGKITYKEHVHMVRDHATYLLTQSGSYKLHVFGRHNLQNINAAKLVCNQLGITDIEFYKAISTFKGAAKRLQVLKSAPGCTVYLDFAHAPSKVKATVAALREQYPGRKLVACLELHTFSSLNSQFLGQYKDTLSSADKAAVFYSPDTLKNKQLPDISPNQVKEAFGCPAPEVFTQSLDFVRFLKANHYEDTNLLLMSSGNFRGIDIAALAREIIP